MQAAGAEIAAKAKALRAKTAAVAFVGLPDLSHADKVWLDAGTLIPISLRQDRSAACLTAPTCCLVL